MRQARLWSALLASCGIVMPLLLLSACDVSTPSQVKTGEIRLMDGMRNVSVDARNVRDEDVSRLAEGYKAAGKSRIMILLPYMAGNPVNKLAAEHRGALYKSYFAKYGVTAVDVDYQVVKDAGQARRGVLTYMAETAVPPRDCAPMLGYNGTDNRAALEDYKFGCESKTALSHMVVQPSDLMGHAGTAQNESRREGAVTENYKSGKPNEPLKNAYTASTVGSSGG